MHFALASYLLQPAKSKETIQLFLPYSVFNTKTGYFLKILMLLTYDKTLATWKLLEIHISSAI